jgi:hypothetical protein
MANQSTYTTSGTDRGTYVDRNDNKLIKMILPFIVGLVVGYGANGLVEKAQHNDNGNGSSSYSDTNPGPGR